MTCFLRMSLESTKKLVFYDCSTHKVVNCKGLIYAVYHKNRASWKKSYAMCMVGSPQYYSLLIMMCVCVCVCVVGHKACLIK